MWYFYSSATFLLFLLIFLWWFEMEFLCVTLAVLELALETRLSLSVHRSACLYLLSPGIEAMHHHCLAYMQVFLNNKVYLILLRQAHQELLCVFFENYCLLFMSVCFAPWMYVPHMHAVPVGIRRNLWPWSYFRAVMEFLGFNPGSFEKWEIVSTTESYLKLHKLF